MNCNGRSCAGMPSTQSFQNFQTSERPELPIPALPSHALGAVCCEGILESFRAVILAQQRCVERCLLSARDAFRCSPRRRRAAEYDADPDSCPIFGLMCKRATNSLIDGGITVPVPASHTAVCA
jgi:hypothetical protein